VTSFTIKPTLEVDFALPAEFPLRAGGVLRAAKLHYAVYGNINAARDNVVLVCHALSGSALVAEWWRDIFSRAGGAGMPGHAGLIDLETQAVLGINILGSCYGSTGPTSIDPATGLPYGVRFPLVQIADTVRAQSLLLDSLGIHRLQLAIGASLGGMQTLEWARQFPERIAHAIAIGAAPLGAMGLGLNHMQRQAIQLDPAWKNGDYAADEGPRRGLALARALAVCSYKSPELFEARFARKPDRSGEDPYLDEEQTGRFDVAGYLDHQGEKFNQRFDANAYLALTRTMDLWDPARGRASTVDAWRGVKAKISLIGISSDWLFPVADVKAMQQALATAGVACTYQKLVSEHGHDAFLAEPQQLFKLINTQLLIRE
jgi:homoserine O-acetyltransferase